eukprot:7178488-Prymnesium_polylepis.2
MILDSDAYVDALPWSVEAVFYQESDCTGVWDGPKCEEYSREAHGRFLEHFAVAASELPLLRFDAWDWERPFSAVPGGDSVVG